MYKLYTAYNKSYTSICIVPCKLVEKSEMLLIEEIENKINCIKNSYQQETGLNQYEGALRALNHGLLYFIQNLDILTDNDKVVYLDIPNESILLWIQNKNCKCEYTETFRYTLNLMRRLENAGIRIYSGNTPKSKNIAKTIKSNAKVGRYKPEYSDIRNDEFKILRLN